MRKIHEYIRRTNHTGLRPQLHTAVYNVPYREPLTCPTLIELYKFCGFPTLNSIPTITICKEKVESQYGL